MGEASQTHSESGGIPAILLGAGLVVACLSLLRYLREHANYDPVEEAQRIARQALGIRD